MKMYRLIFTAALLSQTAWAQPASDSTNQSGPNPRGLFSAPTGGVLRNGEDEGFGLGPALGDPTSFEGTGRQEVVLPGSRYVDSASLTGHYGIYFDPRQRLMLTATGGTTVGGLDLDYSFIPEGMDGYFSIFVNQTRSYNSAYMHGHVDLGKFTDNTQPWLFRTSTGLGYTTDPSQNLTLSAGVLYQHLSLRNGPFAGLSIPYDPAGHPLTVSGGSTDNLLLARLSGLYMDLDNLQFPTTGDKLRFQADQSVPIAATGAAFTRFNLNYTHFQHLRLWGDEPQTLIFNVQGGSAIGLLPQYESYNLGGVNSVRGYQLGELGGGRSFVQSSLEFRAPIGSLSVFGSEVPFRFAAFVDYGSSFRSASQVYGQPGLVRAKPDSGFGYGLGLQALSDFGLIRLEAAFAPEGRRQINFSVGDRY
ncbi:MAG: BamA/TamA family outer membrane protein [Vulcanimicrobiota bacterium]